MSDAKPLDVIRQIYAAFGRKDLDGMLALMAEDITWRVQGPADVVYFGSFFGRDAVRQWSQTLRGSVHIERLEIGQLLVDGDHVAVLGDFTATVVATGRSYSTRFAHLWRVRDGLAVSFDDFIDTAAAVAAHAA